MTLQTPSNGAGGASAALEDEDQAEEETGRTDDDEAGDDAEESGSDEGDEESSEDGEDETAESEEGDDEDGEGDKPKPKNRRGRKIEQLSRRLRESEARAERAERAAADAHHDARLARQARQSVQQKGLKAGDPEYDQAVSQEERAIERAQDREEARVLHVAGEINSRLEEAGAKDAQKALHKLPPERLSTQAVDALFECGKHTARVARMLTADEALFERFENASPLQQVKIIARLEGRLLGSAAERVKAKGAKPKPKPTPHVKGAARANTLSDKIKSGNYTQAEYEQYKARGFK